MEHGNGTSVAEFVLLGLSQAWPVQLILFLLFILFYLLVLPGNVLIILTIQGDPSLGCPMYFLLANLAFLDICYSSITPPKMLANLLYEHKTISYMGCMAQLFFLHFLGAAEMFLLVAMAYDRFIAICKPLHYMSLVSRRVCYALVGTAWTGGFLHATILVGLTIHLPFCGPNVLDNFFCDVHQVIRLACTNTYTVELVTFANNGLTKEMMGKAAYTCITHIIVIFVMFCPAIYLYTRPFRTFPMDKVIAVFHTVIFPLLNPMIYTFRNKEIINSIKKLLEFTICKLK
uniref:Olfactory receptor n=1 Tax=Pelusios castaneus TaxID=367368 RepID=A0A8C8RWI1_9SAUR